MPDATPSLLAKRAGELNATYGHLAAPDMLGAALQDPTCGTTALVSSFGAESVVLLHMVAELDPNLPVLFVDTHMLFPETLGYLLELSQTLGLQQVRRITPSTSDLADEDPQGDLHQSDTDACCMLRKTRPLHQALRPFESWITGRKRFQATSRAQVQPFETDGGKLKINPLFNWSPLELATYMDRHSLPRHLLVAKGYRSIGCAPCTQPTADDADPRAGRWAGEDKIECGIHFSQGRATRLSHQGLTQ